MVTFYAKGVDLSVNQPVVDLQKAKLAGQNFVFINSTQGADPKYTNPYFMEQWNAAKNAGLVRGVYHFAYPQLNGPQAEAHAFLAAMPTLMAGDFVIVDFEKGYGDLSGWLRTFLDIVEPTIGFKAVIYGGVYFLQSVNVFQNPLFKDNPFWDAAYQSLAPGPWPNINYVFWQHTDAAQVNGIPGGVDESYALTPDWQKWGKPVTTPSAAEQYYFQLGHTINTTHAIWTAYLLPAYVLWQSLIQQNDSRADIVCLGPVVGPEESTTWGGTQPASIVRTTNCTGGVYLGTDGTWNHPFRVEINT